MVTISELVLLGWTKVKDLEDSGVLMSCKSYEVKRWPNNIQIYRRGLPCCIWGTDNYSKKEMEHLMKGLRLL
jgi:hypothetical protein